MALGGFLSNFFGSDTEEPATTLAEDNTVNLEYEKAMKEIRAREAKDAYGFANRAGKGNISKTVTNSMTPSVKGEIRDPRKITSNAVPSINPTPDTMLKNTLDKGQEPDLIQQALDANKYNQDNKYRVSGLNLSNETGDYIASIANALFR